MRLSAPIYQLKRRAKLLARDENIPLHQAQARIAAEEGFTAWSLLAARVTADADVSALLPQLVDGDMLLIAARPGHGKTRLGLRLLLDAALDGRRSALFSLEYTEREAMERFRALADPLPDTIPEIITTDDICADYIIQHLRGAPSGSVALIDYLQILDQRRTKPPLSDQMKALQAFTRSTGVILAVIAQIDRSYASEAASVPGFTDLRLPNPIPANIFSKACFLNAGEVRLQGMN
ncbi:DNA helicase [Celeribacter indicus]|uniref:Replicative DNA helicase n=1 Tax=Celeribacter indicus TaxID=1208324 RepID=A0A0B5DRK6_9RHOB|nr:DNA helicase [Celeribacter indicus]AJE45679.1 replicative DNA helicase [Celeribacter indicus]SDX30895.1 DnaB-like helicase C terminal domain-containing protein [Celeribacter indicus]